MIGYLFKWQWHLPAHNSVSDQHLCVSWLTEQLFSAGVWWTTDVRDVHSLSSMDCLFLWCAVSSYAQCGLLWPRGWFLNWRLHLRVIGMLQPHRSHLHSVQCQTEGHVLLLERLGGSAIHSRCYSLNATRDRAQDLCIDIMKSSSPTADSSTA